VWSCDSPHFSPHDASVAIANISITITSEEQCRQTVVHFVKYLRSIEVDNSSIWFSTP